MGQNKTETPSTETKPKTQPEESGVFPDLAAVFAVKGVSPEKQEDDSPAWLRDSEGVPVEK